MAEMWNQVKYKLSEGDILNINTIHATYKSMLLENGIDENTVNGSYKKYLKHLIQEQIEDVRSKHGIRWLQHWNWKWRRWMNIYFTFLRYYEVFLNDILVFTFAKFVMRINVDYFCRIGLQNVLYYSSKGTLRAWLPNDKRNNNNRNNIDLFTDIIILLKLFPILAKIIHLTQILTFYHIPLSSYRFGLICPMAVHLLVANNYTQTHNSQRMRSRN